MVVTRSTLSLHQVHRAAQAQGELELPLFTGFVSHEQLEAVIGNTSHERWLASRKELTHWVKMRGPGAPCPCLSGICCFSYDKRLPAVRCDENSLAEQHKVVC